MNSGRGLGGCYAGGGLSISAAGVAGAGGCDNEVDRFVEAGDEDVQLGTGVGGVCVVERVDEAE